MTPPTRIQRDFIGAPKPTGEPAKLDLTIPPFHSRPNGSEGYDDFVKRLASDHARLVERHNKLVEIMYQINHRLTLVESHEVTAESIEAAQKQLPVLIKPRSLQEYCHHVTPRIQMRLSEKGFEESWCTECDLPIMENEH